MSIKHSPGCGCCCSAITGGNVSYTAGTTYEIPYDLTSNMHLDATALFPASLWEDDNAWGKIELMDPTQTTLHESLEISPNTDFADITDFTGQVGSAASFAKPAGFFYDTRGFGTSTEYELSDASLFHRNKTFKYQEPQAIFYRIKSVTAGTFSKLEGYARSLLKDWKYDANVGSSYYCENTEIWEDIYLTTEKGQYIFFDDEASLDVNIIRAHNPHGDCDGSSPGATWGSDGGLLGSGSVSFANDDHSESISLAAPTSGGTLRLLTSGFGNTNCNQDFGIVHNTEGISVSYIPILPATGDGHFQIEAYSVYGIEGSTTTLKVVRTGGNSTAVDVVVAVGNTDVTISFAAGDQYKTFDITHVAHDGHDFSTTPIPTNSKSGAASSVDGGVIVLRDDHWEYGSDVDTWHGKSGSTQEFYQWNPFQRSGWTYADLTPTPIRAFVSMSLDGTLGTWSVQRLLMEGTDCSAYPEVNGGCPVHDPCPTIFPYHTQQYEIEVTLDANYSNISIPSKLANAHNGCGTQVVYEADDPDFQDYVWRWAQNSETIPTATLDGYETDFYASGHWASQDFSITRFSSCGNYTENNNYSNHYVDGYVNIDPDPFQNSFPRFQNVVTGSVDKIWYPLVSTTTPTQVNLGSSFDALSLSSIDFVTENIGGWTTTDGIKYVKGEFVDISGTNDGTIATVAHNPLPGTTLGNYQFFGRLGKRLRWWWVGAAWHYSIYEKYSGPYNGSGPQVNHYIGQEVIPDCSVKLTSFTILGLQNNHPDLWYEVSGSASDDGYYRIYWDGVATAQSGPHVTSDDGAGNVWAALPTETPVSPEVTYSYWSSDWTSSDITGVRNSRYRSFGQYKCDVIDNGYTRSVTSGSGGASGTLTGTWVSTVRKQDKDGYAVYTSPESYLITTDNLVDACDFISYAWLPADGPRPDVPDELQNEEFNSDVSHILAEAPGIFIVPNTGYSPPAGKGWVYNGSPTRVTGSFTAEEGSGFNPYSDIICDGDTKNYFTQNTAYWDFNSLNVWAGQFEYNTNSYRIYDFFYVVGTSGLPADFGVGEFDYGPSHSKLLTASIYYRIQWLPCWNGMEFPENISLDGDVDIDDGYTTGLGLRDVMLGFSASSPQWVQENTLGIYPGVGSQNYRWTYSGSINWEVLDPMDFNISANKYSPLWSKD